MQAKYEGDPAKLAALNLSRGVCYLDFDVRVAGDEFVDIETNRDSACALGMDDVLEFFEEKMAALAADSEQANLLKKFVDEEIRDKRKLCRNIELAIRVKNGDEEAREELDKKIVALVDVGILVDDDFIRKRKDETDCKSAFEALVMTRLVKENSLLMVTTDQSEFSASCVADLFYDRSGKGFDHLVFRGCDSYACVQRYSSDEAFSRIRSVGASDLDLLEAARVSCGFVVGHDNTWLEGTIPLSAKPIVGGINNVKTDGCR